MRPRLYIYAYIDADSNRYPNFYTKTIPTQDLGPRPHHRIKNKSDRNK